MKDNTKCLIWFMISMGLICIPFLSFDIKGYPMQMVGFEWVHLSFFESNYLYLLHHLLAAGPVIFFGIVLNMYSYRKVFVKDYLPSVIGVAAIFIVWDILFAYYKIWSFEKSYFLGLMIFKLPIEEYLWFLVIPFCGLFVYHICESHFKIADSFDSYLKGISLFMVAGLYYIGMDKLYTAVSLALCGTVILFGIMWKVPRYGLFLCSFGFLLIPMTFFNGMLTGLFTKQALVVYNWQEFSNIRFLSFPVEDISFGFSLIYGTLCFKYYLNKRLSSTYEETK